MAAPTPKVMRQDCMAVGPFIGLFYKQSAAFRYNNLNGWHFHDIAMRRA
jgi:hypothetical protein